MFFHRVFSNCRTLWDSQKKELFLINGASRLNQPLGTLRILESKVNINYLKALPFGLVRNEVAIYAGKYVCYYSVWYTFLAKTNQLPVRKSVSKCI